MDGFCDTSDASQPGACLALASEAAGVSIVIQCNQNRHLCLKVQCYHHDIDSNHPDNQSWYPGFEILIPNQSWYPGGEEKRSKEQEASAMRVIQER